MRHATLLILFLVLLSACSEDTDEPATTSNGTTTSNSSADTGTSDDTNAPDTTPEDTSTEDTTPEDTSTEDTFVEDTNTGPSPVDESLAMILADLDPPQVPLEPIAEGDPALIALGKALFFDPILSGNKDIACASCHFPTVGSADGLNLSVGTGGSGVGPARAEGAFPGFIHRHAIDLFNRGDALWTTMFWDSRVAIDGNNTLTTPLGDALPDGLSGVLSAQALFPMLDRAEMRGQPLEMAVDGTDNELGALPDDDPNAVFDAIIARLRALPDYAPLFAAAYPNTEPDDWTIAQVTNAIAAYEAKAFSFTDTPWDRYLRGDLTAMNDVAKIGAAVFFTSGGCGNCHSGALLSDQKTHVTAVPQIGSGTPGSEPFDYGREHITGADEDRFAFRTPPLRNVALSAPYMHNGSILTLERAVAHYGNPDETAQEYDTTILHPDLQDTVQQDPAHIADLVARISSEIPSDTGAVVGLSNVREFLKALTDPAAIDLSDTIPATVPSGLPVPKNDP